MRIVIGAFISETNENTGFGVSASSTPGRPRAGSLPPPTQFAGTFYGDYAGIGVTARAEYPIWADTRPPDLFRYPGTAPRRVSARPVLRMRRSPVMWVAHPILR